MPHNFPLQICSEWKAYFWIIARKAVAINLRWCRLHAYEQLRHMITVNCNVRIVNIPQALSSLTLDDEAARTVQFAHARQ